MFQVISGTHITFYSSCGGDDLLGLPFNRVER
jgi:hypothetical protein